MIHAAMNPEDCRGKNAIKLMSTQDTGFGTQILQIAGTLLEALKAKKVFVVVVENWKYGARCSSPNNNYNCYFKPSSHCTAAHGPRSLTKGHVDLRRSTAYGDKKLGTWVPEEYAKYGKHWFAAQLVAYITRMNKETASLVKSVQTSMQWSKRVMGVHIRQGDKVTGADGFGEQKWTASTVQALISSAHEATGISIFFLATDSTALLQASLSQPGKYTVRTTAASTHHAIDGNDCLRGDGGCNPGGATRAESAWSVLLDWFLLSEADAFIGSCGSLFSVSAYIRQIGLNRNTTVGVSLE
jgi:hypothetical protein